MYAMSISGYALCHRGFANASPNSSDNVNLHVVDVLTCIASSGSNFFVWPGLIPLLFIIIELSTVHMIDVFRFGVDLSVDRLLDKSTQSLKTSLICTVPS